MDWLDVQDWKEGSCVLCKWNGNYREEEHNTIAYCTNIENQDYKYQVFYSMCTCFQPREQKPKITSRAIIQLDKLNRLRLENGDKN